ncbi:MAG: RNA polymerase subunit sigma [Pseudonocardiales bacterium]|nr:RNA polymerase subunit sigma [Pseudonocardiales bacterium]
MRPATSGTRIRSRLASVLEVVYLVFNEGYTATAGADWMRRDLCREALRLGRLLAHLAPTDAEVHGLVALMELQESRSAARTGPSGEPIALHEQRRERWDQLLIRRGVAALLRARQAGGPHGPYVLQAAIAVCHAQARTTEDTDWAQITALYEALARVMPSPVVQLNRAVAVAMASGPEAGLALADTLVTEPAFAGYHRLPTVRGDLLARLGRHDEAQQEFERAAELTLNLPERAILLDRAAAFARAAAPLAAPSRTTITLAGAARAFLSREDMNAATVRSYGQTLSRLRRDLGDDIAVSGVSAGQVAEVFTTAWGTAAAATWNRHRGAVRSFAAWIESQHGPLDDVVGDGASDVVGLAPADLAAEIGRRPEPRGRTRPMDRTQVEALCARTDLAVRERVLWLLLYESAASAGSALTLNVEDLDVAGMRGRVTGSGWVQWRSATAELLPHLVAGRRRGPLFLSDRRPGPGRPPAPADLCPETGRRRLSYERAEYLFKQATGHTLHQLRTPGNRRAVRAR